VGAEGKTKIKIGINGMALVYFIFNHTNISYCKSCCFKVVENVFANLSLDVVF
jgi:hypothetical protein